MSDNEAPRPLLVTAAVIYDGRDRKKILIARRKLDAKNEAGKWEFPGGKVDFGESPDRCIIREIKEELDVEIKLEKLYDIVSHVDLLSPKKVHIVMLCYLATTATEPRALDVQEVRWVGISDLASFEFAKADMPIVAKLVLEDGV